MSKRASVKERRVEALSRKALSDKEKALIDAYWRAANYLSVGQIYLFDNPLLKQAARPGSTSSRGCSATGARRRA